MVFCILRFVYFIPSCFFVFIKTLLTFVETKQKNKTMKRILLTLFACVTIFMGHAQSTTPSTPSNPTKLEFEVKIYTPVVTKPRPKAPAKLPTSPDATLSENNLTFLDSHAEYTLYIIDEDGEEVYEVFIPENTSIITLPLNLSGEYELQLVRGEYCFYTYVEL